VSIWLARRLGLKSPGIEYTLQTTSTKKGIEMGDFIENWGFGLLVCAVLMGLGGIAFSLQPSGKRVSDGELCEFRFGETTEAQVLAILGKPSSRDQLNGGPATIDVLTYHFESPDFQEATLLSFEGNRLTEVAATKTLGHEGAVAQRRGLPACLTTGVGRRASEVVPGPWRPSEGL
jgi:hypothetical protein